MRPPPLGIAHVTNIKNRLFRINLSTRRRIDVAGFINLCLDTVHKEGRRKKGKEQGKDEDCATKKGGRTSVPNHLVVECDDVLQSSKGQPGCFQMQKGFLCDCLESIHGHHRSRNHNQFKKHKRKDKAQIQTTMATLHTHTHAHNGRHIRWPCLTRPDQTWSDYRTPPPAARLYASVQPSKVVDRLNGRQCTV